MTPEPEDTPHDVAAECIRPAPHINFVQKTLWEIYKTHHSLPQAVEAFTAMQDAANDSEYHPHIDDLATVLGDMFEEITTALFGDNEETE